MAGELRLLINPSLDEETLQTIPQYMDGQNIHLKFLDYERYRDDTKILIAGNKPKDIILSLTAFAKAAFPQQIPISMEYSTFMQSFLNCCFFCNFAGRSFSTYPRLNVKKPSNSVHVSSNTWPPQLLTGFMANMVAYSRICTEPKLQNHISNMLQNELMTAGHSQGTIRTYRRKAEEAIKLAATRDREKYEKVRENQLTLPQQTAPNDIEHEELDDPYPPGVIYDRSSNVFTLGRLLVANSTNMIPVNIKAPPPRSSPHLKAILASKSKYKFQSKYL